MSEVSSERRAWVAILLSIVVLLIWGHFYKPPAPQHPASKIASAPPNKVPEKTPPTVQAALPAAVSPRAANQEQTIAIESALYRVELSNRGAVVRSWKLENYHNSSTPPRPLDLVNPEACQQLGAWPFSLKLDDPKLEAEANSSLYRVNPSSPTLHAPAEVTFEWSDGHLNVTKRLKFPNEYQIEFQASVTLDGQPLPARVTWRGGFGDTSVYKAPEHVDVFYDQNGKLEILPYNKLGVSGHADQHNLRPGTMDYVGIEDQFFAAAFLPNGPGLTLWDWSQDYETTPGDEKSKEPVAEMAAGSTSPGSLSLRVYVGPKDLSELGKLKPSLDKLVQYGWTGIIAKPLLEILKWIYRFVPNYGWAIVLLTIAINLALFPLKVKSWRSMQRMQRLTPQVNAIKQKYAKYSMRDPRKRKMNEEVMALYHEEGVNPMTGCLPMLVQFPIWWALYRMLMSSIDLRHAPWILWVHDLSARDPYYILPVLMVVTMYLMQKMTPTATMDPTQRKLMNIMPVAFGLFFFALSSGLILYIFTSNLVGIAQQYYLNRTEPLPARSKFKKRQAST